MGHYYHMPVSSPTTMGHYYHMPVSSPTTMGRWEGRWGPQHFRSHTRAAHGHLGLLGEDSAYSRQLSPSEDG
eukprot:2821122-Pyramimonas_sp.AAC.1